MVVIVNRSLIDSVPKLSPMLCMTMGVLQGSIPVPRAFSYAMHDNGSTARFNTWSQSFFLCYAWQCKYCKIQYLFPELSPMLCMTIRVLQGSVPVPRAFSYAMYYNGSTARFNTYSQSFLLFYAWQWEYCKVYTCSQSFLLCYAWLWKYCKVQFLFPELSPRLCMTIGVLQGSIPVPRACTRY